MLFFSFDNITKNIHKILIKSTFRDYINENKKFMKKYPKYNYYVDNLLENYDKMDQSLKKDLIKTSDTQDEIMKKLISNLNSYCKNYPHEKICQNRFLTEYSLYPYRFHQNVSKIVNEL
jgi:hypothetical protein